MVEVNLLPDIERARGLQALPLLRGFVGVTGEDPLQMNLSPINEVPDSRAVGGTQLELPASMRDASSDEAGQATLQPVRQSGDGLRVMGQKLPRRHKIITPNGHQVTPAFSGV